jgi:hypothetical protein
VILMLSSLTVNILVFLCLRISAIHKFRGTKKVSIFPFSLHRFWINQQKTIRKFLEKRVQLCYSVSITVPCLYQLLKNVWWISELLPLSPTANAQTETYGLCFINLSGFQDIASELHTKYGLKKISMCWINLYPEYSLY